MGATTPDLFPRTLPRPFELPTGPLTRVERLEVTANVARHLRIVQRRYFKQRDRADLVESKRLEAILDGLLGELRLIEPVA